MRGKTGAGREERVPFSTSAPNASSNCTFSRATSSGSTISANADINHYVRAVQTSQGKNLRALYPLDRAIPAMEIPVLPEVPSKMHELVCGCISESSSASWMTGMPVFDVSTRFLTTTKDQDLLCNETRSLTEPNGFINSHLPCDNNAARQLCSREW